MPGRWLGLTGVAVVALAGGGCGTLVNVADFAPAEMGEGQRRIYGGVIWDLRNEYRTFADGDPTYWVGFNPPMAVFYLVDTVLSAFGDTFTLPVTVLEALGVSLPPWPPPPPVPPGRQPPGTTVPTPGTELPPPREVAPLPPPTELPPAP